jgi:arsenite methyltransferase
MLEKLAVTRDRVLDGSRLAEGETLLDAGCGEGLIGFGALDRGAGHVVFTDISDDLLSFCREAAAALGVLDRCSFVEAAADDLGEVEDASVDVATTRSVLIYVAAKQRAFEEFFRVLRPGGRIAIWEPINRFGSDERTRDAFWGYPADGLSELAQRVERIFREIQPPDDPMLDFDERDLIRFAEEAGFYPIELELKAEVRPTEPISWHVFANSSGNPKVPTFAEAIDAALTPEERERVTEHLRPLVEEGKGVWRMAHALLTATKP